MAESRRTHHPSAPGSFWASRGGLVFLAFLAIGGTLLFTEHRAHVLGILPWLFVLACPLLHLLLHGGHGRHGHGGHRRGSVSAGSAQETSKGEEP